MLQKASLTLVIVAFLPLFIRCGSGLCPIGGCAQTNQDPEPTLQAPPTFTRIVAFDDDVYRVLYNTDGSLYVSGGFGLAKGTESPGLARLDSKGHFDSSFDVGLGFNRVASTYNVSSIFKPSPGDGDLYALGTFDTFNGDPYKGMVRLNSDGSTDSAFMIGAGFSTGGYPFFGAMALDGSGDIYVAGDFTDYDGSGAERLVRINSDGSTDSEFDVFSSGGFDGNVFVVKPAIDGSGDVYVGGDFLTYGGTALPYLARLNSDGTIDSAFDTTSGGAFNEQIIFLELLSSGQLYASGYFTSYGGIANNYVVRLNSDGSLDTSFDADNQVTGPTFAMGLTTDGTPELYVGSFAAFSLHRLEADGTKSTKFPAQGQTTSSNILSLTVDSLGRGVLLTSQPTNYGPLGNQLQTGSLFMVSSNGAINTGFDVMAGADNDVEDIVRSSEGSGKVFIAGDFNGYAGVSQARLIRLHSHGAVDTNFNIGTGFNNTVTSISPIGTDGRLLASGSFTTYGGTSANRIVMITSTGSIDTGFNIGTGFNMLTNSLLPLEDGTERTYIAGGFTTYGGTPVAHLVRLFSDGSIDSSFSSGTGFSNGINLKLYQAPNNDFYVTGIFASYQSNNTVGGMVRINSDGSYDTDFNTTAGFVGGVLADVAVDSVGDVYVVGGFTSYQSVQLNRIVRLNSDATIDSGFVVGTGFNGSVSALEFIPDGSGDLLASGSFGIYNGTAADRVARIRTDGSLVTSFSPQTSGFFSQSIEKILPADDGSGNFFLVGSFTTFDRIPVGRVIRVDSNFNIN